MLYTVAYISDPQLKPTQHENNTYAPWCFVDTCDISVVRCKSERVCVSVCVCVCMKRVEGESCCLSAGPLSNRRETCGGVTHTHTHTHTPWESLQLLPEHSRPSLSIFLSSPPPKRRDSPGSKHLYQRDRVPS